MEVLQVLYIELLHRLTTYIVTHHTMLGYIHHAQLITCIETVYIYMYLSVSNNQLQLAQLETNLHSLFKLICDRAGINLYPHNIPFRNSTLLYLVTVM